MNHDHWKTTNPQDQWLRPSPDDEAAEDEAMQTNGKNGAEDDIDHTIEICAEAIANVFEECAKKYEVAIEAENELHSVLVKQLEAAATDCRQKGQASQDWLKERGQSARGLLAKADQSVATLTPNEPPMSKT